MNYNINIICSCGGFSSQLNLLLSWIIVTNNKNHNLTYNNSSCPYKHCIWKKTIKNINIWEEIFIFNLSKNNNSNELPIELSSEKHNNIKNSVIYGGLDVFPIDNYNKFNLINVRELFNIPVKINISLFIFLSNFNEIRQYFNKIYIKNIQLTNKMINHIKPYEYYFNEIYTIGLHIRPSSHYNLENKYTTNEIVDHFIEKINNINKPNNFKLFIATSNLNIIQKLSNYFGKDRIFYIDTLRENTTINEKNNYEYLNNDWTQNNFNKNINKYGILKYYMDVYLDIILLSKCNLIIGGPSNVFFNALILNCNNKYYIPNIFKIENKMK